MSQYSKFYLGTGARPIEKIIDDSGTTILPDSSGKISVLGGDNITTTGTPNTLKINLTDTTDHAIQVGNSSGSLTSLGVGSSDQILQSGGAGANPIWSTATYPSATSQGDILYSSSDNTIEKLSKDATATRYLSNTGSSNNPAWDQVNLTNGVSGTLPVSSGGTGATNLTDHGILVGSGTNTITSLGVGSTGEGLMGNAGGDPSWTGSPSFSGTVTGDTGLTATTGDIVCTAGKITLPTTTSTAGYITISTSRFCHAYGTRNVFMGLSSGNFTLSGSDNSAIGYRSLSDIGSASDNCALGALALDSCQDGNRNCAIGSGCQENTVSGTANVCLGYGCGKEVDGDGNVLIGQYAGRDISSGNYNLILGHQAGLSAGSSSSSNIYLMSGGGAESNVMRLGSDGTGDRQVNTTYISGIYNSSIDGTYKRVAINSGHKVGTLQSSAFLAYLSTTAYDQTGNGAIVVVDFDTELYDINGDYDSTNTFTAPVTGKYYFGTEIRVENIPSSGTSRIEIITTNTEYQGGVCDPSVLENPSTNGVSFNMSCLANMNAGDIAKVQIELDKGAGNTADIKGHSAAALTYFYGYLVL